MNKSYIPGSARLHITSEICHTDIYKISVTTDMNDGDYITEDHYLRGYDISEFDILLWAYLRGYGGKWNTYSYGWGNHYGHYIKNNAVLPWLYECLIDENFLAFDGQEHGHSIKCIEVTYYDNDGKEFKVKLPEIEEMFVDEKTFADYLNSLYLKIYPNYEE